MARWIQNPNPTTTNTTNVYTGDANYVHDQGNASATWIVNHNLNKYCSVTVVDTANTVIIGQVTYNSVNRTTLTFRSAFAGKAYFN